MVSYRARGHSDVSKGLGRYSCAPLANEDNARLGRSQTATRRVGENGRPRSRFFAIAPLTIDMARLRDAHLTPPRSSAARG
jgi:hypothetical protein